MRKLIIALSILVFLLILAPVFHAQTVTPNLNLNLPPLHSVNWGTLLNANFTKLDSYLSGGTPLPPGFWSANHATSTLYGTVLLNSGPTNTTAENASNKGILNGYAPLDANVLVPVVNLPAVSSSQNGILSSVDYNRFNAGIIQFPGGANVFLNGTGTFTAVPGACSNNCTFTGTTVLPTVTVSGGTIDGTVIGGTTPAAGTFTNLNATTLTLANIDGTVIGGTTPAAGHFTTLSSTGLATLASAAITGGSINSTVIGGTTPSTGAFTTVSTTGLATLASLSSASVTITGGAINGTQVGATTPAAGAFTSLSATSFTGSGAGLTALNASNLSTGTVPAARIPTVAITGGTINNTTIGATTPATGTFTTLIATQGNFTGSLFVGSSSIALVDGGAPGLNAVCLTVSSGCAAQGSGNFNGMGVDTVNFPNRLEFDALQTIQFFVNNGQLGPEILSDGTMQFPKPLNINASGLATSTAVANRSFPIVIGGTTMYMLLSTTP